MGMGVRIGDAGMDGLCRGDELSGGFVGWLSNLASSMRRLRWLQQG
jgi:hypothetical protein